MYSTKQYILQIVVIILRNIEFNEIERLITAFQENLTTLILECSEFITEDQLLYLRSLAFKEIVQKTKIMSVRIFF